MCSRFVVCVDLANIYFCFGKTKKNFQEVDKKPKIISCEKKKKGKKLKTISSKK